MAYDSNGNLTKDLDRDIVTIKYNLLNLPEIIQFKNGNQIRNTYDASGQKLKTQNVTIQYYYTQPIISENQIYDLYDMAQDNEEIYIEGTEYIGNVEYSHFESYYMGEYFDHYGIDFMRLYNAEGYCDNSFKYNYYRRDHLGNNREVWGAPYTTSQGTTVAAATIQRTQYYPSGLPWASNSGDNPGTQNKKYNGKEFVEMHGLDEYDSEARWFYLAINRTTTIDPLAEKYYSISPYAWCGNNPVRMVDLDGRVLRDTKGNIVYSTTGQTGTFQHPSGSTATLEVGNIFTDDGTPIQVFKNVSGDAGWNTNCHGTTFADGQYWLNNDQVPALLKGDGYKEVSIESAKK
jgi:RHS repeat-associated protein